MSPDLIAELEYLDKRLDTMVQRVGEYPSDVQLAPVGKSFAPLKVVEHMYLVEKAYVEFASKSTKAKLAGKTGKVNLVYGFVLKNMAKPSNSAAPTLRKFSPNNSMALETSAKRWREERAKLVQHLSDFGDNDAAIKHPIFGLMSPRDVFILLEKHQDYHDVRLPK